MAAASELDLVEGEEEDEAAFLVLEEDDLHPFVHFPHCKVYLALTLSCIFVTTLMVPLAIGYARPALASYHFEPAQCFVEGDWEKKCVNDTGRDETKCRLRDSRCDFTVIPICFQRDCRCLRVNVTAKLNGIRSPVVTLYDYEDIYLHYQLCTVDPCADDQEFANLFSKIREQKKQLRCFYNGKAAILNPKFRDGGTTVFACLVIPLFLFAVWLGVSIYVVKRTWRVMRRDFKHAVEFRFNAWPPKTHRAGVRPSAYSLDRKTLL